MDLTAVRAHRALTAGIAAGAAAVALTGCGAGADPAAGGGTPPPTAACGPVEFPPLQFGSHLLGDTPPPVPYSSTPPTSGWHTSGAPPVGVFEEPLPETAQVSALEAGGVVVTHHDLPPEELDRLLAAADAVADRVAITPYDQIPPGATAFTSWGALQLCEGVDTEALAAYVAAYGSPIEAHE